MQQTQLQQQQATATTALKLGALSGKGWIALAVALSFVVCAVWLIPGLKAMSSRPASDAVVGELAPVADRDIDGALTTMSGVPLYLSQFKSQASGCPTPLAWVSVVRGSPQAPSTIRIQSGTYVSPIFALSAEPLRIAVPYPAPYETGRGSLLAVATGGGVTIALMPAWRLPPNVPAASHAVVWTPNKRCARRNG
jgi:hypothetical protein